MGTALVHPRYVLAFRDLDLQLDQLVVDQAKTP
jgi:hypothetical protein